jgi:hypothetical protein
MPSDESQLAVVIEIQRRQGEDIRDIKEKLDLKYVTQEEFKLVRVFVYGMMGIAATTLGIAFFNILLRK